MTTIAKHLPGKHSHGSESHAQLRAAVTRIAVPAASAALGVAGGVALGRTTAPRRRTMFGVRMPVSVFLMWGVAREMRAAGRQAGKLAGEVRLAGRKIERIGHALG